MARGARNRFLIVLADGILYHEDEAYAALIASMFTWPEGERRKEGEGGQWNRKKSADKNRFLACSILQIHMS